MENTENETPKKEICVNPIVVRSCRECGVQLLDDKERQIGMCEDCYCEDDGKDEDFYIEQRERELEERAGNCTCGAWQMTDKGEVIHVADCCCGAE